MNEAPKIKLLAWGDYCCSTGFGTVMSNIMRELEKTGKYDITVVGINYSGDPYDNEKWPGKIYPAMPGLMAQAGPYADVYGRQRLCDLLGTGEYDVLFMLQDTFIVKDVLPTIKNTQKALADMQGAKTFKIVYYFPIDATPKEEWATEVVQQVDFPVAYTKYGRAEIAKFVPSLANMPYVYHGTNTEDFNFIEDREASDKFRHDYWNGLADDRFLIINVNRNQPRKEIARTLMIMKELKERGVKPLLYLHMQHSDIGGNIFVMCDQLGLDREDVVLPHPNVFNANQGLPVSILNQIYNAADMVLSTTLGEGWGLSITESFATKTPIVAPDHTSLTEIMADNRGILVPAGNNPSMWHMDMQDMERIRPLMDVEAAAQSIVELMEGTTIPDVEAAYEWAQNNSWENICKYWVQIIDGAAEVAREANKPVLYNRAQKRAIERRAANKVKK